MKKKFGTAIIWIIGIILFLSSFAKLIGPQQAIDTFTTWQLLDYLVIIGIIELLVGILLLVPYTRKFGAFLVFAYFGGAIVTHLIAQEIIPALFPAGLLVIFSFGLFLRYPKVFF